MSNLLRSSSLLLKQHLKATLMLANRCIATSTGYITVDDAELYYEQYGDKTKHTLLCLPGAVGTGRGDFSYQLDHLSDEFNLVTFDPRGYGKSQKTKRQFPLTYFHRDALDASKLMKNLGYTSFSALGWSDGGTTGTILAAQDNAVKNLVIWGAAAFVTNEDVALIEKTRDLANWSERMRKPLEEVYGKEGLQELWANFCDGYCAFVKQPNGDICISEMKKVNCPTLIIHGTKDPMVPTSHAEFLHQGIKDSELIIMPDGKHNLHMRFYEEFNEMTGEFIKRIK